MAEHTVKVQKRCKKHPDAVFTTQRCPVCRHGWHQANAAKESAYRVARYKAHSVEERAYSAAVYKSDPDKYRAYNLAYREANPEKVHAANAAWQKSSRGKLILNTDKYRAHKEKWRIANLDVHSAREGRRRAAKVQATPAWANDFILKEAYHLAKLRSLVFGFKWHVDHIVPLKSKIVCGLHCEANLRVIPGAANIAKGNRYWPDMPAD